VTLEDDGDKNKEGFKVRLERKFLKKNNKNKRHIKDKIINILFLDNMLNMIKIIDTITNS
jgi:hypothetical protein